jgi:hypothetical protein
MIVLFLFVCGGCIYADVGIFVDDARNDVDYVDETDDDEENNDDQGGDEMMRS